MVGLLNKISDQKNLGKLTRVALIYLYIHVHIEFVCLNTFGWTITFDTLMHAPIYMYMYVEAAI